jgi:hypothetical protein
MNQLGRLYTVQCGGKMIMNSETVTGMGYFNVPYQNLPGESDKNHERIQLK